MAGILGLILKGGIVKKQTMGYTALAAGTGLFFCAFGCASASLFATFNLEQSIHEEGGAFQGNLLETTPVIDSALPFQTTVSQTTTTNSVTATYTAYDNGTAAGLNINASASTTALENFAAEGSYFDFATTPVNSDYTNFSFTQPVDYTISYQITGTTAIGNFDVTVPGVPNIVDGTIGGGVVFSQSGTMVPGVVYSLNEEWGLNNIENANPANLSGADAISLTFTAIPEPTSLSLMLLPAALLSRRRRRKASERVQSPP